MMKGGPGLPRWKRVRWDSLRLAKTTGADRSVTEFFAFRHDSNRFLIGHTTGALDEAIPQNGFWLV
jgi:hypothetical protein